MSEQPTNAPTPSMVGAYVSESLSSFVALYSICTNQSKSTVMRNALNYWKENTHHTMKGMVDMVTEKIQAGWYEHKYNEGQKNNIDKRFENYKNNQRQILLGKKVPKEIVSEIINNIKK